MRTDMSAPRTMKQQIDAPMAQLILDLEERGLLNRTLVILASEFGRDAITEGKVGKEVKDQSKTPDVMSLPKHYGMHRHFTGGRLGCSVRRRRQDGHVVWQNSRRTPLHHARESRVDGGSSRYHLPRAWNSAGSIVHRGEAARLRDQRWKRQSDSRTLCLSMEARGYIRPMLICPVRGCGLGLVREGRRILCSRGHSFDVARSGYINLLQPQERRSKQPGDAVTSVAARRRLHDRGLTQPLLRAIAETMSATPNDIVLDAGCGDGFYLATLARETGFDAHGVDISTPAVDAAARRYPECEWVVANADRLLPYADHSFSIVLSITARMHAAEFRRVLPDDGRLLVALPAPEDLIELRGAGRDRVARTVETFERDFTLLDRRQVSTSADLDANAVQDVPAFDLPADTIPAG